MKHLLIIPSSGEGRRMGLLGRFMPKIMFPVKDKPALYQIQRNFYARGQWGMETRVSILKKFRDETVVSLLDYGLYKEHMIYTEEKPSGMWGAIHLCYTQSDRVNKIVNHFDRVVINCSDTILVGGGIRLAESGNIIYSKSIPATECRKYGLIGKNEHGTVDSIWEKPDMLGAIKNNDLFPVVIGIYSFEKGVMDWAVNEFGPDSNWNEEVLPEILSFTRVVSEPIGNIEWHDIGSQEGYKRLEYMHHANQILQDHSRGM